VHFFNRKMDSLIRRISDKGPDGLANNGDTICRPNYCDDLVVSRLFSFSSFPLQIPNNFLTRKVRVAGAIKYFNWMDGWLQDRPAKGSSCCLFCNSHSSLYIDIHPPQRCLVYPKHGGVVCPLSSVKSSHFPLSFPHFVSLVVQPNLWVVAFCQTVSYLQLLSRVV